MRVRDIRALECSLSQGTHWHNSILQCTRGWYQRVVNSTNKSHVTLISSRNFRVSMLADTMVFTECSKDCCSEYCLVWQPAQVKHSGTLEDTSERVRNAHRWYIHMASMGGCASGNWNVLGRPREENQGCSQGYRLVCDTPSAGRNGSLLPASQSP